MSRLSGGVIYAA
jgi:hypothetical protein